MRRYPCHYGPPDSDFVDAGIDDQGDLEILVNHAGQSAVVYLTRKNAKALALQILEELQQ